MVKGKFLDIKVKNFRLFKDMDFDFTEKANKAKNVVVIYGENGAGKSSITDLFSFLHDSITTIASGQILSSMFARLGKNAPSQEEIDSVFHDLNRDIKSLIGDNKRIGSNKELMEIVYSFSLDDKLGTYRLSFSDDRLVFESLDFQVNERGINVFSLSNDGNVNAILNKTVFKDGEVKDKLMDAIRQKFGIHSFLAILFDLVNESNSDYIESGVGRSVLTILSFFSSLIVYGDRGAAFTKIGFSPEASLHLISDPTDSYLSKESARYLERTTRALSLYLKSMYSRIEKVEIVKNEAEPNGRYGFFFIERGLDGKTIRIPFEEESTGTKNVVRLFVSLFAASSGYTVIIDEIDEGIHDVLMRDIMESIIGDIDGQLIITTHNTLLMKTVSPKSIYLLNFEGDKERFYSLDEVNGRVAKDADVIGRYLKGLYGGVPYSSGLSMGAIKLALQEGDGDDKKR